MFQYKEEREIGIIRDNLIINLYNTKCYKTNFYSIL